jgi:hypothetical protein
MKLMLHDFNGTWASAWCGVGFDVPMQGSWFIRAVTSRNPACDFEPRLEYFVSYRQLMLFALTNSSRSEIALSLAMPFLSQPHNNGVDDINTAEGHVHQ